MAVSCNHSAILFSPSTAGSSSVSSSSSLIGFPRFQTLRFKSRSLYSKSRVSPVSALPSRSLEALIFDCDGVILESENLHRQAYNDAFSHFDVRCPPSSSESLNWSLEFYDKFQNLVGGGKPKMRWYFKENGWPTSTIFESPPENDDDRAKLIDTLQVTCQRKKISNLLQFDVKRLDFYLLQDWKTERYKEIIKSGSVSSKILES